MNPIIRHALSAALALLALLIAAAGCGSDDDGRSTSLMGNATDAAFVADMTAHHEQAIQMAKIAQQRAEHPEIRRLADDIVEAQKGEISVMKTIRRDMHRPGEHDAAHMGMSEGQTGMDMDPAELRTAKPFDRAFIDMMVPHHEGAIAMAKQLLDKGAQPALRQMAQRIIRAQYKEIAQMHAWRKAWYGSAIGAGHNMDAGG